MPLSEHEQRLLEQMERALYAEDPKFASSLRSSGSKPGARRSAVVGVLAALAGVAALVAGAATSIVAIGVLGFVLMLVGTFLVIRGLRAPAAEAAAPSAAKPAPAKKAGFMDKAEERFRKRREGGEL
ncbi:MAG TPA: DUF3040 domain-containing protein [Candidatus Nanopelagicales bacterium]|nr:DUF3040 domain-containing protein [Candidatus Nanopelagicales bacterium]